MSGDGSSGDGAMRGDGADVLVDLRRRGLVHDHTDEDTLVERLAAGPITVYCGFDPTADSLHVGNLVPLLTLRRFQRFGHRPVALAGGATGMIGDPSGRSEERNLLDAETLDRNLAAISGQLEALLDFDAGAVLVDNREWTSGVGVLEFLRDVGKHVTVNTMLAKESIRTRLASEHGLSYTEFSYMLLQAHDFWALHERLGCEMQIGGSDQWGNITAGIDLIRRKSGARVHGLTVPLVTRSDGQKFGKTAEGAVWLSPQRTLPYEFHQYFLRVDDADVERFLLQLTFCEVDEVAELMVRHREAPEKRLAQRRLADEVTALVHGPAEVARATRAAEVLFGTRVPDADDLASLRGIVPETVVDADALAGDEPVVDLAVLTGVCSSRSDARRTIAQGGLSVNGIRVASPDTPVEALGGRFVLVQRGRRTRHLVVLAPGGGTGA